MNKINYQKLVYREFEESMPKVDVHQKPIHKNKKKRI